MAVWRETAGPGLADRNGLAAVSKWSRLMRRSERIGTSRLGHILYLLLYIIIAHQHEASERA